MLKIGLTGGIGSGKTAVSDAFEALGVPVVDTDILAREVVMPGQPALADIAAAFGRDCLTPEGQLDRRRLRQTVFQDPDRRRRLEAILHPRIRAAMDQRIDALSAPYCIVVVPLLIETGMYDLVDRVLVVDVPEAVQIQRVTQRDTVDEAQARRILAAQASRGQRRQHADEVIENTGDLPSLQAKVRELHQHYLRLADS